MDGSEIKDGNGDRDDVPHGTADRGRVDALQQALGGWRTRLDELRVQLDLGTLDLRDEVHKQLEVTENSYLAARSQLARIPGDTAGSLRATLDGVEAALADLRRAYDDVVAVLRRARED
jgi:hypothetical protein